MKLKSNVKIVGKSKKLRMMTVSKSWSVAKMDRFSRQFLNDFYPRQSQMTTTHGKFIVEAFLGSGTEGHVYLVQDPTTSMRFVIKKYWNGASPSQAHFSASEKALPHFVIDQAHNLTISHVYGIPIEKLSATQLMSLGMSEPLAQKLDNLYWQFVRDGYLQAVMDINTLHVYEIDAD